MTKKRVYEIAKEWGMTGQDLAAELRGWGFTDVKTHMTALDDSIVMVIEGRLEAYGKKRVGSASEDAAGAAAGDLSGMIRRKKKGADEAPAAPAPAHDLGGLVRRKKKSPEDEAAEATPPARPQASAPAAGDVTRAAPRPAADTTAPPSRSEAPANPVAKPASETAPAPQSPVTRSPATAKTTDAGPAREPARESARESAQHAEAGPTSKEPAQAATTTGQTKPTSTTPAPKPPMPSAPASSTAASSHQAPKTPAPAASSPEAAASAAASTKDAGSATPPRVGANAAPTAPERAPSAPVQGGAQKAPPAAPASAHTTSPSAASAKTTSNPAPAPAGGASTAPLPKVSGDVIPAAPRAQPRNAADAAASSVSEAPAAPAQERATAPAADSSDADETAADAGADSPSKIQGTEQEIVRPGAARRAGKVVGFVDLSKLQSTPAAPKRDSRRLRSADDEAAPNVQPTLGKDRRKAFTRGADAQRSTLSAQELRERESGRVLRTSGPTRGGPSGPGGRGPMARGTGRGGPGGPGGPRRILGSGSPFEGQHVQVESPVTVKQLAEAISLKANDVLKKAFGLIGFGVNINSVLDEDTAILLAGEFGVELEVTQAVAAEDALLAQLASKRSKIEDEHLILRPPTVAVLGHVDHGKTTLIDTIRRSQITDGESGGITQHIGAYQVTTKLGHRLSIIDTPGHAAFTSMRARGAKAVDIVILVVAADDGVMPQTEEAINHARAARVPIVVAINKMDRPEANPERVMNELAAKELIPEEWGGPTAMLKVSALKGDGIEDLLERVFLESEVLELKAHPSGPATGVVLEAEMQEGRGRIAHLLVQDGSLKRGDVILAGEGYGKVRSMQNDRGEPIDEAGPSMPVEVTGLSELPTIGERFYVVESLDSAQEVASERARANRMMSLVERKAVNRENLFQAVAQSQKKTVNLVVRADVQGSLEVLKAQLIAMQHDEVEVKIIDSGVGAVSESNVDLAISSDATIMAFHVGTNPKARQNAERGGVEIRNYTVLYEMLNDVTKMMEGTLSPEIIEEITGHVEIRRLFKSSKIGNIAGCHVIDGKVSRDSKIRLLRDGMVVWTGQMGSLRREKDEVKDVREGFDCGIVLKNYDDIREGDILEAFRLLERKRKI